MKASSFTVVTNMKRKLNMTLQCIHEESAILGKYVPEVNLHIHNQTYLHMKLNGYSD
jgi:hypothetical protein